MAYWHSITEVEPDLGSHSLGLGYKAPETSSTPAKSWDEQNHIQLAVMEAERYGKNQLVIAPTDWSNQRIIYYLHHGIIYIPTNSRRSLGHHRALRL